MRRRCLRRKMPAAARVAAGAGASVERGELLAFFEGKVAKWQIPDDVVFVDPIPLGATGKMQKIKLREQFRSHVLPSPP